MRRVVGFILVVLMLGGCTRGEAAADDGRPRVVVTTTMVGDLVKQIAGDAVSLRVMMGAGVDPHTYKPSVADLGHLRKADLVFYNGLHLEGKMISLFERKLSQKAYAITADLPAERLLSWQEGEQGAHDPHIWFDVRLWARAAETVRDKLVAHDPGRAETYRRRAEALLAELNALDEYVRREVASIPKERRVLITSHDAYAYFGRAYGIEVVGLQGISTEGEAGLSNINAAADFIASRGIPAIFVESSVSPKTIERVVADCAARGVAVEIGGELYSDAMGAPGEHAGYEVHTYVGMVRYNVDTLVKGLK